MRVVVEGSTKPVGCMDGSNSDNSVMRSSTFLGGVCMLDPGLGEGLVGNETGPPCGGCC